MQRTKGIPQGEVVVVCASVGCLMQLPFLRKPVVRSVCIAHNARRERCMKQRRVERRLLGRSAAFNLDALKQRPPCGLSGPPCAVKVPSVDLLIEVILRLFNTSKGCTYLHEYRMGQSLLQRDIRTEAIASFTLLPGVRRDHLAAPRPEFRGRILESNNEVAAEARRLPRSLVQPMDGVIPDDLVPLRPYFNEPLSWLSVWFDQQIRSFIRGKGDSQHP